MKNLLALAIALLTYNSASAFEIVHTPGGGNKVTCPLEKEHLLQVLNFAPSADSNSSKGICTLEVVGYQYPAPKINLSNCDSQNFLEHEGKTFIIGSVSYREVISKCESIIGCQYSCKPQVTLSPF